MSERFRTLIRTMSGVYSPVETSRALTNETAAARVCHLKKNSSHNDYGFYFYQENFKQVVGIVDEGSSADKAGLKVGDSIVEVNDIDIKNASHEEVVAKIKSNPLETKLLVINLPAIEYYKNGGILQYVLRKMI